jgi:hypothetical protein
MNRPTLLLSALCLSMAAWPLTPALAATAAEVAADLRMIEESAPMRRAADRFVAGALANDATATSAMLSRALVERIGPAQARQAMRELILPFFADGGEVGRSVTTTRTTDAAGQTGFAFYMWLVDAQGRRRPFTVYVVDEQGMPKVANIVPDKFVPGRHQ